MAIDAKYGITCNVCNFREGKILCGCEEMPMKDSHYCKAHRGNGVMKEDGEAVRVLRHRVREGIHEYKIDGRTSYCTRAALPQSSIQAYEVEFAQHDLSLYMSLHDNFVWLTSHH